jgi:beta-glucosidase
MSFLAHGIAQSVKRTNFPADFVWGTATSAYQVEGAAHEDGRGLSIWDTFCRQPGKTLYGDNGDIACDHYHRYKEDVALMRQIGLNAYRFSISWSRVLPDGRGKINERGLDFYDRLTDELLGNGIQPYATLYHWDLPQTLQDDGGGWVNRETAYAFAEYAEIMARRLGDRVAGWMTLNEPFVTAIVGYLAAHFAPGERGGQSGTAAVHHQLLGHGLAVQALRANLRRPGAEIGIALSLDYSEPANDSPEAHEATRLMDAYINKLFLDPLYKKRYPAELMQQLEPLLPQQPGDMEIIGQPMDFLGFNYYTRNLQSAVESFEDMHLKTRTVTTGDATDANDLGIYPEGLYRLLKRLQADYPVGKLYITENGFGAEDVLNPDMTVHDSDRVGYLQEHIGAAARAVAEGVPLAGYFVWSFMDNFEWLHGYKPRLGLVYVDYPTQRRILKDSAFWYQQFLKGS